MKPVLDPKRTFRVRHSMTSLARGRNEVANKRLDYKAAQSLEPPSTAMMSPVIQRASSETRNVMTEATSSGWPIRFNVCIPITAAQPSSVLVKVRHVGIDDSRCDGVDADAP